MDSEEGSPAVGLCDGRCMTTFAKRKLSIILLVTYENAWHFFFNKPKSYLGTYRMFNLFCIRNVFSLISEFFRTWHKNFAKKRRVKIINGFERRLNHAKIMIFLLSVLFWNFWNHVFWSKLLQDYVTMGHKIFSVPEGLFLS